MKPQVFMTKGVSAIVFGALLILCAVFSDAQVSVSIAPDPHPQFIDGTGKPLAGGFLYTYQAGTTTPLNTYVDSTGTIQNTNPIPLDSTGSPSNGSTQTGIWLANTSYKFCAYSAALVLQWCTDNVTGYLNLLNLANTWTFAQTFSLPITDTTIDNQIVLGAGGNQTTLDFPPPGGNVTLHFPNIADTVVARTTTDTLINKTLNLPLFNSSACAIVNGPGTYACFTNQNPTGTTLNFLAKLTNAPSQAVISATTDTGGIVGVCVSGCANSGTAVIQQSGPAPCAFDPTTVVSGDYVQNSATVTGKCSDVGATFPLKGQVLGRVQASGAGSANYTVDFFGPEINPAQGLRVVCGDGTSTTVNANTTAQQPIKSCQFAANALNTVGKVFRITTEFNVLPAGAGPPTSTASFGWGASAALGTYLQVANEAASNSNYFTSGTLTCLVITAGAGAIANCVSLVASTGVVAIPTSTVLNFDSTAAFNVGTACSFTVGSASNSCNSIILIGETLN